MVKAILTGLSIAALILSNGCRRGNDDPPKRIMYTGSGGKVKTLDPALAADLASRNMTANVYDTLLQYSYSERPYKLEPSMLTALPESNHDMSSYTFKLRDDLYFRDDRCFKEQSKR